MAGVAVATPTFFAARFKRRGPVRQTMRMHQQLLDFWQALIHLRRRSSLRRSAIVWNGFALEVFPAFVSVLLFALDESSGIPRVLFAGAAVLQRARLSPALAAGLPLVFRWRWHSCFRRLRAQSLRCF